MEPASAPFPVACSMQLKLTLTLTVEPNPCALHLSSLEAPILKIKILKTPHPPQSPHPKSSS